MTEVFNLATVRSRRVQRKRWTRVRAAAVVALLATASTACPGPPEPKVPPRADGPRREPALRAAALDVTYESGMRPDAVYGVITTFRHSSSFIENVW